MTDQELQDVTERAEIEGHALADVVTSKLHGEIWKACATWTAIAAFILFCFYRSDFAALREDLQQNVTAIRSDFAAIREDLKTIRHQPIHFEQQQSVFKPKSAGEIREEYIAIQSDLLRQNQELARNAGKSLQSSR